jgi:hypothetical protein
LGGLVKGHADREDFVASVMEKNSIDRLGLTFVHESTHKTESRLKCRLGRNSAPYPFPYNSSILFRSLLGTESSCL